MTISRGVISELESAPVLQDRDILDTFQTLVGTPNYFAHHSHTTCSLIDCHLSAARVFNKSNNLLANCRGLLR